MRDPSHLDERLVIASHLRRAKGRSIRFLALRYVRALNRFLENLEPSPDPEMGRYPALPVRQIVALKIVGEVAAERLRLLEEDEHPEIQETVSKALAATTEALEAIVAGDELPGLKSRYRPEEEELSAYLVVFSVLADISERGRMG